MTVDTSPPIDLYTSLHGKIVSDHKSRDDDPSTYYFSKLGGDDFLFKKPPTDLDCK